MSTHEEFMRLALREAQLAGRRDEVPVGAVLVSAEADVLAAAGNRTVAAADPTAHAEILALRAAARSAENYRLLNTTLYVTIEPCPMCMGAILHARVATLVFGAADPKWGAAGSLYDLARDGRLNHRVEVVAGVLEHECREMIQAFFRRKR
ncbi:MAG: tRNA adenosine(34) deaminase TadA [Desulfobacterales bacterium]|jgi:tRNA(adenine34) deaminase|nr:tRNA adenosine(34) deaminase TadA [Desulfobacterales bacterium]